MKQNNCVRSIFFVNNRQSASPYYQLLEILKLENIVKLKTVHDYNHVHDYIFATDNSWYT